ncbi:MAG: ATP phosphoribosyltransferase regulatory subunit [Nitrospirae bacterium]|nr:ATP phosphoribosyltransferase regulatory subunit [Nitrospirota bacterium]
MRERSLVPVGMATILPEAARHVRRLESQLLAHVNRWGYDEIILPTFEYLDVLAPGLEPELIEKCYQFADRTTGRILLLRPDATAQIARTVAMGMMGSRLPLRLSYRATVFRYEPEHAGRDREIFQVGAELIGADDPTADCEIISLLTECLQRVGLHSFKISLGHVGFFKGLLVRAGLSLEGQKRAEQAAARKDLPRLEEILLQERVTKTFARAILEAPELCGQAEVLARGRELTGNEKPLVQALDRLTKVYQLLCSAGYRDSLFLDLGEFRGFDYYDGVVFDVFADGVGVELGGGGRYDHLIGRFGRNIPSTGFALNVDRLFQGLDLSEKTSEVARVDVLVVAPRAAAKQLVSVAGQVRQSGHRVVQQILSRSGNSLLAAASEAGLRAQADTIIIIDADGTERDQVLVLRQRTQPTTGRSNGRPRVSKKTMSVTDFVLQMRRTRAGRGRAR